MATAAALRSGAGGVSVFAMVRLGNGEEAPGREVDLFRLCIAGACLRAVLAGDEDFV